MFKDKEYIREFINGYIYNLAKIITLYIAVICFTINPLEAEE